jgi:spore coat polysaccharide biosynthesis protein SpsF
MRLMDTAALKILTIMQVRKASTRLPGKALLPIMGEPLFIRQLERMKAATLAGPILVATTTNEEDDEIAGICAERNIPCFRGDSSDLLDRHYQAAVQKQAEIVVKIPSDCPLIDPAIIDRVIGYFLAHRDEYDFVSNLHPATYPDGNDVEVMSFKTLETAWKNATANFEREHTTPYIWERVDNFRIGNITMENGLDYSLSHRWTIDYQEDYNFIKKVYDELYASKPLFTVQNILELLNVRPEIYAINSHLAGVNWYRHHLGQLKTIGATQTKLLD